VPLAPFSGDNALATNTGIPSDDIYKNGQCPREETKSAIWQYDLIVKIDNAIDLPTLDGDWGRWGFGDRPDSYAKVFVHFTGGSMEGITPKRDDTRSPQFKFGCTFQAPQYQNNAFQVKVEVHDQDNEGNDKLIGTASLTVGGPGDILGEQPWKDIKIVCDETIKCDDPGGPTLSLTTQWTFDQAARSRRMFIPFIFGIILVALTIVGGIGFFAYRMNNPAHHSERDLRGGVEMQNPHFNPHGEFPLDGPQSYTLQPGGSFNTGMQHPPHPRNRGSGDFGINAIPGVTFDPHSMQSRGLNSAGPGYVGPPGNADNDFGLPPSIR
jgi:hypothetical protein